MRSFLRLGVASVLLPIPVVFGACQSTYGGYGMSGSAYYDDGFSDPWYYGGYHWDDDDIAVPPDGRPKPPPRPEHPIARPLPQIPADAVDSVEAATLGASVERAKVAGAEELAALGIDPRNRPRFASGMTAVGSRLSRCRH